MSSNKQSNIKASTKPDIIVIGSGAGGGFACMELTKKGYNVTLLERGKRYSAQDYQMNKDNWQMAVNPLRNTEDLFDYDTSYSSIDEKDSDITSQSLIGKSERSRTKRGRFTYHRVLGLGGSTLHYQGEAHRFAEHAFRSKSLFGWGEDWPLSYDDLALYYQEAENVLGVAGQRGNPFKPDRGDFPTLAHDLSTKSQLAKIGADKLGWQLLPNTLALPTKSIDGRMPCQHSGGCVSGCIFGAKSSTDLTAIKIAEDTGRLTIIEQARVIKLNHQGDTVVSVDYLHEDTLKNLSADTFIIAAGAIETPRLLLHSNGGEFPNGLGNQNDQVGRNFMETIFALLSCQAQADIHSYKGAPLDSRIWDFYYPKAPLITGFALGTAGTLTYRMSPKSYNESLPGFGLDHKKNMRETFGKDIQFYGIAEHIPSPDNRIILSEKLDKQGMPLVKVISDYSIDDKSTLRKMIEHLNQWVDACPGVTKNSLFSSYSQPSATHVAGTCRMGVDEEKSVTDENGKIHGMTNVYITDGSIMPSQGAGDSPSLTIQALAIKIARRI